MDKEGPVRFKIEFEESVSWGNHQSQVSEGNGERRIKHLHDNQIVHVQGKGKILVQN